MPQVVSILRPNVNVAYREDPVARTVTGDTGPIQWLDGVTAALVSVNVTAVAGTASPSVTVSLQQQDGNGQWYQLGTTAALTATGLVSFTATDPGTFVAPGGIFRVRWVIAGTNPSYTFQVSVQCR